MKRFLAGYFILCAVAASAVDLSWWGTRPSISGGTLTTSGGDNIHTFTTNGYLTVTGSWVVQVLVVGGGGSGGPSRVANTESGGGGGGGGVYANSSAILSEGLYLVTVGAGGDTEQTGLDSAAAGYNGNPSSIGSWVMVNGGGHGGRQGGGGLATTTNVTSSGGGGGGRGWSGTTAELGGYGTDVPFRQGYNGGSGKNQGIGNSTGGGGGGSSAVGTNGDTVKAGNGGAGTDSAISGVSVNYAAGGGGGARAEARGFAGGTSAGDGMQNSAGLSATGPGGGGGGGSGYGGDGFRGVVIIRYTPR